MNQKRAGSQKGCMLAMLGVALLACAAGAETTVKGVVAKQRYPWNGLVDVSYTIVTDQPEGTPWTVTATAKNTHTGTVYPMTTIVSGAGTVKKGANSFVWNMAADAPGLVTDSLTVTVSIAGAAYGADGMVRIPAGTNSGTNPDNTSYNLIVDDPFWMDATEISWDKWNEVRDWAVLNGYEMNTGAARAGNHPVHSVYWRDVVKWCNARSEMEGFVPVYRTGANNANVYRTGTDNSPAWDADANGYRLPTRTEWQYAARGGLTGKRFPWGDTITHAQANYNSSSSYAYDISYTRGYHPATGNADPRTLPVGSFAPNGYGLYDMAGNVSEWCWDLYSSSGPSYYYGGGGWTDNASSLRCSISGSTYSSYNGLGFRCVRR